MSPDDFWRALLDPSAPIPAGWPAGWWGVLLLFLVPVGGGIPAGVLMGRDRGVSPEMLFFLYFVSDVILAFVFEPMLHAIILVGRFVPPLGRLAARIGGAMQRAGLQAGGARGPVGLVLVSFGVDPMTGRAAAAAVGHGFVTGWALAITGDMFYFAVLMASTLWLNSVVGSERITIALMLVFMLVMPALLRRWRGGAPLSR